VFVDDYSNLNTFFHSPHAQLCSWVSYLATRFLSPLRKWQNKQLKKTTGTVAAGTMVPSRKSFAFATFLAILYKKVHLLTLVIGNPIRVSLQLVAVFIPDFPTAFWQWQSSADTMWHLSSLLSLTFWLFSIIQGSSFHIPFVVGNPMQVWLWLFALLTPNFLVAFRQWTFGLTGTCDRVRSQRDRSWY